MKRIIVLLFLPIFILTFAGCSNPKERVSRGEIIVTGKRFTEQMILTHILGEYLKAKSGLEVKVKANLGGIYVLTESLKQGDIDMYIEYTGTAYLNVLKRDFNPGFTPTDIYNQTRDGYKKKFNITWLKPLGYNNAYAIALRKDHAKRLGVKTISDLAKVSSQLTFGSDAEFYERADGYNALVSYYHIPFGKKITIDPELMYKAISKGTVDVIPAYSTDARIELMNLQVLKDDRQFFPPYFAVPLIRQEVLDAYPKLEKTINALANSLDNQQMMQLNKRVNIGREDPKDVAIQFLKNKGLIN